MNPEYLLKEPTVFTLLSSSTPPFVTQSKQPGCILCLKSRRDILKSRGGGCTICPPVGIGLPYLPKSKGGGALPSRFLRHWAVRQGYIQIIGLIRIDPFSRPLTWQVNHQKLWETFWWIHFQSLYYYKTPVIWPTKLTEKKMCSRHPEAFFSSLFTFFLPFTKYF